MIGTNVSLTPLSAKPPPSLPPLVGRDRELAAIAAAVDSLPSGRGGLFLVAGPAGIGKTRLADEATRAARIAGVDVHWGRAWEGGGAPPFWPWIQVLRSILATLSEAQRENCFTPFSSDLSHLLGTTPAAGASPTPALDSEQSRFRLFDAVAGFLSRAAACVPRLLILDDLHDADASSLHLLRFVARGLPEIGALIVATYRDGEVQTSPLASGFAALSREGRPLTLAPLRQTEVREIVAASGQLPEDGFVEALCEMSAGIPYFVDAILRQSLAESRARGSSALGASSLVIPAEATAAALYALDELGSETLDLLGAAAAIGAEFSSELLARITGADRGTIEVSLTRGEAMGALERRDVTAAVWHFRHAIIREALYRRPTATQRSQWHARIGARLAAAPDADDRGAAEVATHYLLAAASDSSATLRWTLRAGEQAEQAYAYEQAASWYRRALTTAERSGDTDTIKRSLAAMAHTLTCSGESDAARETYQRLWEIARRESDATSLGRAALGLAHHTLLPAGMELPIARPSAADYLNDALVAIGDSNPGLHAMLLARLALEICEREGATARAEAMSAAAVSEAEACRDSRALAYCVALRHTVVWGLVTPVERLSLVERIRSLARAIGDVDLAARTWPLRLTCLLELGDVTGVERELREWEERRRRQPHPLDTWYIPLFRSCLALARGAYRDAAELAHRAMRDGYRLVGLAAVYADGVQQLFVRRDLGKLAGRRLLLRELVEATPDSTALRVDLALLDAEIGELDSARKLFESLAANDFKVVRRNALWLGHLCLLSDVAVALDDRGRSERLLDLLRPQAENCATVGAVFLGSVSHYLAKLALQLGQLDAAEAYSRASVERHAALQVQPWEVRSTRVQAAIAQARGERGEAARLIQRSEALAVSIRMMLLPFALGVDGLIGNGEDQMRPRSRDVEHAVFAPLGESWRGEFGGQAIVVPAMKGCEHIAYLLRHSEIDVTALDLLNAGRGVDGDATLGAMSDEQLEAEGLRRADLGDAGARLDRAARRAYQGRLVDLREDLSDAERNHDLGRAERARREIEVLGRELRAAVGLDGRDRVAAGAIERARLTVTKRIRTALQRIESHHPALARYLGDSIHTGAVCRYSPPPDRIIRWHLD